MRTIKMFSSNQRFDVTCTFDGLAEVINFAVKLSGCEEMFTRSTNKVMPAWQVTSTGKDCLGRGSMAPGGIHPAGLILLFNKRLSFKKKVW